MLKQEKKEFGEQNAKKQLRIIQTTCILDQLVEFLACQGTDWIPVILPADATVPVDEWTQKTWPENACMAVMTSGTSGKISCFSGPLEAGMIIFLCRMRFFI